MKREQAIEIAVRHAAAEGRAYYGEGFVPHEWVVNAILEAANHAPANGCAVTMKYEREEVRDSDPEREWDTFWRGIVCNADGSIDVEQLKKELSDFSMLIGFVPRVYDDITGGMCTKAHAWPSVVIALADENVNKLVEDALQDVVGVGAQPLPFDPGYVYAYLKAALLSVEPEGLTDPQAAYFMDWFEQVGTAAGMGDPLVTARPGDVQ